MNPSPTSLLVDAAAPRSASFAETSVGLDLRAERLGLRLRIANLRVERGDLLVERAAASVEQRALARDVARRPAARWRAPSAATSSRRQRRFRRGARTAHVLGTELILQQAQLRIAADVADDDERLAGAHLLPVADENLADDAAFLVLHASCG